jgi:hypothetical protein
MSSLFDSRNPGRTWWNDISGPSRLLSETGRALLGGQSVCLCTDLPLPFRDMFLQLIVDALRETENSLLLDDTAHDTENPGMHLIERFDLQYEYRETMQPMEFLHSRGALSNRLLPVVAGEESVRGWLALINSRKSGTVADGLFLLQTDASPSPSSYRKVRFHRYSDFVTHYDTLLFAGLMLGRDGLGMGHKRYISSLAVSLCGSDAEAVSDFTRRYRLHEDPADSLSGKNLPGHVLQARVWDAQVQELFPLIMRESRAFIERFREQVVESFAYIGQSRGYAGSLFPDGLRNSNDEPVNTPEELELSTIVYLMRRRRRDARGYETAGRVLDIPDESAGERMELLYRMRNSIAHGTVCKPDDVVRLLESPSQD